ncbi:MAG TPA: NUDIX domain-containing protein [Pseudohaliea sp.]|nr:NUDIX domain-containing protein [Pseudohaliea sp.]
MESEFTRDDVEILEKRTVFQGFFRILRYRLRHRLFRGGMGPVLTRELFDRGHSVAVLPYDPRADAVVLLRQFRVGALDGPGSPWLLEIIAGAMEDGESAEEVARREALEEAGCTLQALEPICSYWVSPGGASERVHLYCGHVDSRGLGGIHGLDEEGEDIEARVVTATEAFALLDQGRLDNAPTMIAMQWLMRHREDLRRRWG